MLIAMCTDSGKLKDSSGSGGFTRIANKGRREAMSGY